MRVQRFFKSLSGNGKRWAIIEGAPKWTEYAVMEQGTVRVLGVTRCYKDAVAGVASAQGKGFRAYVQKALSARS